MSFLTALTVWTLKQLVKLVIAFCAAAIISSMITGITDFQQGFIGGVIFMCSLILLQAIMDVFGEEEQEDDDNNGRDISGGSAGGA